MLLSTDGVVLRVKPIGNDDNLYTILTRERGLLSAYARNRQRISRGMGSALEQFSYSNFVLFQSKERYSINSASGNKVFFGLRTDIVKTALASYFAQLLMELAPEEGEDPQDYLRLFLNTLAFLESDKRSPDFLKPVFELRLMVMAGYMPDLLGCAVCGESEGKALFFRLDSGTLVCGDCLQKSGQSAVDLLPLSGGQLAALRHILYAPMERLFSFALPEEALERLSFLTERYITVQLDKHFSTLDFYHSIVPPKQGKGGGSNESIGKI